MIKLYEEDENRFSIADARRIGDELNLSWNEFDIVQFWMGLNVETEHDDVTDGDPILIAKIALAHLREVKDYYTKLKEFVENS